MPFDKNSPTRPCPMCSTEANFPADTLGNLGIGEVVHCFRCGDFVIAYGTDCGVAPISTPKGRALASHVIRKWEAPGKHVVVNTELLEGLSDQKLPSPAEAADNLLLMMAKWADDSPGKTFYSGSGNNPPLMAIVGVVADFDLVWLDETLRDQKLIGSRNSIVGGDRYITWQGWKRIEDLRTARIASRFAFFARRFANLELDDLFEKCLRPTVEETGYELRTVTQRAGLIDAVVEDEIRRCRFLIADLSDANAGAYWEAGFAEGLGKPVIYICRAKIADQEVKTHFDTDHRQTVRWGEPHASKEVARRLKAVIQNTLLGDAKRDD
jgi:hypothetical protein